MDPALISLPAPPFYFNMELEVVQNPITLLTQWWATGSFESMASIKSFGLEASDEVQKGTSKIYNILTRIAPVAKG